jgi:hypothetical protein
MYSASDSLRRRLVDGLESNGNAVSSFTLVVY